jgi:hypothetical protein
MSQANDLHLYKNSTLDGKDIAFDILLSHGLITKTFSDVAANGILLSTDAELLVVYGDVSKDCFIQLGADAVMPGDGILAIGLHFIPAGNMKIIDPDGATVFGIIAATAGESGKVIVECAHAYDDARKRQQFSRK